MNKRHPAINAGIREMKDFPARILMRLNLATSDCLKQLSRDMIAHNGLDYQISICMEEITELVTELVLDTSFENTASEIADVWICLYHVTVGYKIATQVSAAKKRKIQQPQFMSGHKERLSALLDLQKELIKHTNRKKDNIPQIIERTADAYVALAKLIAYQDNLGLVYDTISQKVQRTYQRNQ